jgi:hypothetical protein
MDIKAIKKRLNALASTDNLKSDFWKPQAGTQHIRIVPNKFSPDNPFVELLFHYGVSGKTYLSPLSFGDPDPIAEFADKLRKTGDSDDWRYARKMEPKLRTFAPVIVRGEESEGVRWWGFGKTVYQDLLATIADPDYGDITDPKSGRDLTVENIPAKEGGTTFPTTKVRPRGKETPLGTNDEQTAGWLENQKNITDIYKLLSYDELKEVLAKWLNPDAGESDDEDLPFEKAVPADTPSKSEPTDADIASKFEDYFK